MNAAPAKRRLGRYGVSGALTCLFLWFSFSLASLAQTPNREETTESSPNIHATHVLGFAGTPPNAHGYLAIQGESLRFESSKKTVTLVRIDSIQDILLSSQDNQVGGVPMTLGKAAVPFGGGRVVSLFSHRKYDGLTLIYLDNNGGVHGAIFQLAEGQGAGFEQELINKGAHTKPPGTAVNQQRIPGATDASN